MTESLIEETQGNVKLNEGKAIKIYPSLSKMIFHGDDLDIFKKERRSLMK